MSYKYDSEFFDFVNASAGKSANRFIDAFVKSVVEPGQIQSVLDVGCGRGVWAAEWLRRGISKVRGVDGDYVERSGLLIPVDLFLAKDISKPFDVGERFDLVQCLEVGEHIPKQSADVLIANLARHGDVILFSAAIPGQGGEFHVNEQPYAYWRSLFADRGYEMYDAIRPIVKSDHTIEPWYRYNAFVFANNAGAQKLTAVAVSTRRSIGTSIGNVAPLSWRLRCGALSLLPAFATNAAARLKHRIANRAGT